MFIQRISYDKGIIDRKLPPISFRRACKASYKTSTFVHFYTTIVQLSTTMADSENVCSSPPRHNAAQDVDDLDASTHSYVCTFNSNSKRWECSDTEYKKDVLQELMNSHDNKDGRKTIDQLKDFG